MILVSCMESASLLLSDTGGTAVVIDSEFLLTTTRKAALQLVLGVDEEDSALS